MLTHPNVAHLLAWAAAPGDAGGELGLGALTGFFSRPDITMWIVIAVAGLIIAYYLMLVIVHWSKKHGARSPLGDAKFLDRVESKGGLTRDELRRVREAYMRQTFPGEKPDSKSGATVQDLMRMASLGSAGVAPSEKRQTPPPIPSARAQAAPPKPAKAEPRRPAPSSLNDILVHHDAEGNAAAGAAGEGAPAQPPAGPAESEADGGPRLPMVDLHASSQPRRFAPDVTAPAKPSAPAAGGGVSLDLDTLLARGLIGQEEYDRLRALAQQVGGEEPPVARDER